MAEPAAAMRLDRFLWFARLARSRSVAQALAEGGHLRIDGRPVSSSHAGVRVGQVLSFPLHGRVRVLRVEALPGRRGPAPEARATYREIEEAGVELCGPQARLC
jgi:ribosome-associated heat shock protein Hsp15